MSHASNTRGRLQLLAALAVCALAAAAIQAGVPLSPLWAVLDVVIHGTLAAVCVVGCLPRWGTRSMVVAVAAGVLIDLDHLVAAHSPDPMAMMSLPVRPPAHSLLGVLILAALIRVLGRWRDAYAGLVGMLAHLLWDCVSPPGVVLFYPLLADTSVVLPAWAVMGGLLLLSLISWLVGRRAASSPAPRARPAAGSQIETVGACSGRRR